MRLNTNENPYGPSQRVQAKIAEAVAASAGGLNRYPDREAAALRQDLANYLRHGLVADQSVGSQRVQRDHGADPAGIRGPGRTCLSFAPTYSMYPEYARDTFTRWVVGRRNDAFEVDVDSAVTLIASEQPSCRLPRLTEQPDRDRAATRHGRGDPRSRAWRGRRRRGLRGVPAEGTPSALSLLSAHPRLLVTRTMSKAFALAGGRLGYVAASTEVVDALRVVRLPYHLSARQPGGCARGAWQCSDELLGKVAELRSERDSLVTWLRDIGLSAVDSDANFVLFGRFDDRHAVWQALLDRGVLIRETGPDGWLRVSVGTPDEMAAFRDALVDTLQYTIPQEAGA